VGPGLDDIANMSFTSDPVHRRRPEGKSKSKKFPIFPEFEKC